MVDKYLRCMLYPERMDRRYAQAVANQPTVAISVQHQLSLCLCRCGISQGVVKVEQVVRSQGH